MKTIVINGRISSRSYPRYRLIRPFFRRVLADVDRFCMQSEESARRLIDLGADPARVTVTGSLKFDSLEVPAPSGTGAAHGKPRERAAAVLPDLAESDRHRRRQHDARRRSGRPEGVREDQGHAAARAGDPGAAPARAIREVERLARDAGFVTARRSELPIDAEPRADVVVLDSIGELAQLYQVATVVFVGGSLADHGGHNILEPAVFGKPVVFGPHMQNFKEIAEAFVEKRRRDSGAVRAASSTTRCWRSCAIPCSARASARRRARWSKPTAGAKDKTLAVIGELLPPAGAPAASSGRSGECTD